MWPLPTIDQTIVNIVLRPEFLSLCIITPHTRTVPFAVKQYTHIPLDNAFKRTVFNPTHIADSIKKFLMQHRCKHAFITWALSGPSIIESMVAMAQAHPQHSDFSFAKLRYMQWDFCYLHSVDNGHLFYVCGIPQELLLQIQLIAIQVPLNIVMLTTERMAQLRVYHYYYGAAFRQAQLSRDLAHNQHDIQLLCKPALLQRLIRTPALPASETVSSSLGLFLMAHQS